MSDRSAARAHAGLLLWALLVGLSFPAVGLMSEGLPPLLLTAIRFMIAALALWPLVHHAPSLRPGHAGLLLYALMGLCLTGFFGAMFWAAHRASAVSMATLFVSVPLLAYCLGLALRVERLAWRLPSILLTGALGALALAWAESGGDWAALRFGRGEAVFFVGCIASALYPVLSKWGLERGWLSTSAGVRTFWSLALGGALIALVGLVRGGGADLARMTPSDALILVYLGLFSSGLTFWLQQRATAVLTPGAVTAYSYLVPFVSMLLLFIREPQRLDWTWLPGSLLVMLAIALLLRRDVTQRRAAAARNSSAASVERG
ncbi:MAG: DMT family transporter [Pseudomonadota bacterium]|nr:DMT family transporter [Pseudomonadota bacterium]